MSVALRSNASLTSSANSIPDYVFLLGLSPCCINHSLRQDLKIQAETMPKPFK